MMNDENCKPPFVEKRDDEPESNRSNKKRRASTGTVQGAARGGDQMDWKQLFQALRDERMTAAEEQLRDYMTENQNLVSALKSYSSSLKGQLDLARQDLTRMAIEKQQVQQQCDTLEARVQQLESSQLDSKRESSELETKVQSLESKLREQERELWMYRKMTSTTLSNFDTTTTTVQDPNLVACDCQVSSPATNASTSFRLASFYDQLDKPSLWFKYVPLTNQQLLPDFLHTTIEFDMNQLPSLLQNVILSIYPEDEEEEEDES